MPIEVPESAVEVDERARTDVARVVTGSNPFLPNSFWGGLISSISNRIFDFYAALSEAIRESIPDTAESLLDRWAAIWGVTRIGASLAGGEIDIRALVGTPIPATTVWVSSSGQRYTMDAAGAAAAVVAIEILSLVRGGSTVTVTTDAPHRLGGTSSDFALAITGSATSAFNLDPLPDLTITGETTLSFTAASGANDNPSAAVLSLSNTANGATSSSVTAITAGSAANQFANEPLTIESPVANVLETAHVVYGGISGGNAQETDDALRLRYLDRVQNPVAHFSVAEITATAKTLNGVTRVFVSEATPALGQVTVYFIRGNDASILPDAAEVLAVKTALIGGTTGGITYPGIKPANTADADVIVSAPTASAVAFTFTALAPDTTEMRAAVTSNLEQMFEEDTSVGVALTLHQYTAAIYNTVDPITGLSVTSYTLSTPTTDQAAGAGVLRTLGTVTYSI